MNRRGWLWLWFSGLVAVCVLAAAALISQISNDPPHRPTPPLTVVPVTTAVSSTGIPQEQRWPVAGAEGFYVIITPDGATYLEEPGQPRKLLSAPERPEPATVSQAKPPEPPPGLRQVVVCDDGIVNLPTDAILTFVGKSHATALLPNGVSVTYHTDGRVEARGRRSPVKESAKESLP